MTRSSPLPGSCWLLALLVGLAVPAAAQLEEQPGFFPIDDFDLLATETLSLEINLSGALLELVAAAMDDEDPQFAALVRGLEGIRVRMAEAEELDLGQLRSGFDQATGWLRDRGWETLLRLREEDEEVHVYTRMEAGDMVGAALLVLEPEGAVVLVNVVGKLDLALLAALADSLDIPQLDVAGLGSADDEPEAESEEMQ